MHPWFAMLLVTAAITSCKTTQPASSVDQAEPSGRGIQCGMRAGFSGVCQVIDVSGRLDTTTEAARAANIGAIKALRFVVPGVGQTDQASVVADSRSGGEPLWMIDEALDLYNRRACIAQVSGGIFGEAYAPKLTMRTLFNVHDASQTGFAEISDHRGSKAEHATVTLKCDWQKQ
jgi:hypothetical protein